MNIGYACINMTMPSKFRTCRLKTVEEEGMKKIKELALLNLQETLRIVEWNKENGIFFYRMSSDLIPFATHPVMDWDWAADEEVTRITDEIKAVAQAAGMRLSVHPGQYTLINSPNPAVVEKAVADLVYHEQLLMMTGGTDMILHVGGVYGDKRAAMDRFAAAYHTLPEGVRRVLRIENDDKSYTIDDVLQLCAETGAAACFDIHHHMCCNNGTTTAKAAMKRAFLTWDKKGIRPKVHISSGKTGKTDRSHHDYILKEDWAAFLAALPHDDVDVMVEAKQKDKAALALIQANR